LDDAPISTCRFRGPGSNGSSSPGNSAETIFQKIVEINQSLGITNLLVEQNANLTLEVSHYGYVLETAEPFCTIARAHCAQTST
jgi:ABC-type branched-subunit amino acid transport system ATPase component